MSAQLCCQSLLAKRAASLHQRGNLQHRIPIAGGAGGAELALDHGIGQLRAADAVGIMDVEAPLAGAKRFLTNNRGF